MGRDEILEHLEILKKEHRKLDDMIESLTGQPYNQLEIQRLKKRKLVLKDEILHFESALIPDIIA